MTWTSKKTQRKKEKNKEKQREKLTLDLGISEPDKTIPI